jgi:hypothetical protein
MKTIEAVAIILVVALAISIYFNFASYMSYQQLNMNFNSLNQSYTQLNASLINIYNQLNNLQSLLLFLSGKAATNVTTTTNSTLGLSLSITVNTTVLRSGQAIAITLDEFNALDGFNNVTTSDNWAYSDFQGMPCTPDYPALPNLPFSIAIVQGYYTESNLTGAVSLPIFSPPGAFYGCPYMGPPPTEFDFYPSSDLTIVHTSGISGSSLINESATQTLSFNGYCAPYNSTSGTVQTINFSPGVYTIIGGDEWGQLAVLHFIVL